MRDKTKKLTRSDVNKLYEIHGTTTRDQASVLLGGDPVQAQIVTIHLFRSMIGLSIDYVASAEKLPLWIADEVVRLCLIQTGNTEVADWQGYLDRHPEEKAKNKRAKKAEAERVTEKSNVIPFRRPQAAEAPATKKAREALRAPKVAPEALRLETKAEAATVPDRTT